MARGECHNLLAPAVEKRIASEEQRPRPRLCYARESGVDLLFAAGMKDGNVFPHPTTRGFDFSGVRHGGRKIGIGEHGE
jgi:hypothetical protein